MGCRTELLLVGSVFLIISSIFTRNSEDFMGGLGILLLFGIAYLVGNFLNKD